MAGLAATPSTHFLLSSARSVLRLFVGNLHLSNCLWRHWPVQSTMMINKKGKLGKNLFIIEREFYCFKLGNRSHILCIAFELLKGSAYWEILSKTTKSQTKPCSLPRSLILYRQPLPKKNIKINKKYKKYLHIDSSTYPSTHRHLITIIIIIRQD